MDKRLQCTRGGPLSLRSSPEGLIAPLGGAAQYTAQHPDTAQHPAVPPCAN